MIYGDRKRRWLTWTFDLLPLALLAESFRPLIVEWWAPDGLWITFADAPPPRPIASITRNGSQAACLLFATLWAVIRILPRVTRATNLERRTDLALTPRPPAEWLSDQLRGPLFRTLLPIPTLLLAGVLVDLYVERGEHEPIWSSLRLYSGVAIPAVIVVFLLRMTASLVVSDCLWPKDKIAGRWIAFAPWLLPCLPFVQLLTERHPLNHDEHYYLATLATAAAVGFGLNLGRRWSVAAAAYPVLEWAPPRRWRHFENEFADSALATAGARWRKRAPLLAFCGFWIAAGVAALVPRGYDYEHEAQWAERTMGDYEQAAHILTKGLRLMPRNGEYLRHRARCYEQMRLFDLAAADRLTLGTRFSPYTRSGTDEFEFARMDAIIAHNWRLADEINDRIERSLDEPPGWPLRKWWLASRSYNTWNLRLRRGVVHFLRGHYSAALHQFEAAEAARGEYLNVPWAQGYCLLLMGEEDKAEALWRKLAPQVSDKGIQVAVLMEIAQIHFRRGDFQKAHDHLEGLLKVCKFPPPDFWIYSAAAADGLGRATEARIDYSKWEPVGRDDWMTQIRRAASPPFLREYFDHDPHTDLPDDADAPTTGTLAAAKLHNANQAPPPDGEAPIR